MNQSSDPNTSSVEINTHTIVDVDWLDAVCTGGSEWQTQEEVTEAILAGPSRVRSVGYLIYEDDKYIAIVDTIITDGDSCGCSRTDSDSSGLVAKSLLSIRHAH